MAKVEQSDQELALEVGNAILKNLIQLTANPLDSNAWKVSKWHISIP
jgi:hypothetical protein